MRDYPFSILDVASVLHLAVRRELSDSVYVDCPFCQKKKGKMNLNIPKSVWRCNRCGEGGHMIELYARLRGLSLEDAELDLIDTLCNGADASWKLPAPIEPRARKEAVMQSEPASPEEIDKTMRAMLQMLTLTVEHRRHLHEVRGLADSQIEMLGLKSTPSYKLRTVIPRRLMAQGCAVAGVPGFYVDRSNRWAANFTSWTSGIMIPVRSVDGLIRGAQIRLDVPIRNKDDPEDEGTKYIWFSTSGKHLGASSGSPVNFIGDPCSRTIYVTEGCLKAGIAHCMMERSFLSIQGANNLNGVKEALQQLQQNGAELLIEAHDMDKFNNRHVAVGASKLCAIAKQCGMECRSLTWNPNYKGIDDWQLAIRRKREVKEVNQSMNEMGQVLPEGQCRERHFRIYQLDLTDGRVIPFAYQGIKELQEAGYSQPPAAMYRLIYDGHIMEPSELTEEAVLRRIFERFNDDLPAGYDGHSIAPSDVVELYDENTRRYFYRDTADFVPVRFSPALCRRPSAEEA